MLKNKIYTCEICKTKPDQLSHHKTHLETQKHKDKKELFELKLSKLSSEELQKLYNTTDISIIVDENETNKYPIEDNKKLIICNSNNEDNNTDNIEMSENQKKKIELSNNVTNKEALKDKIHEIHNYLRNNGAGYGMNALKVFNLLYGLKKIEEKNLLDKVKLKRPECEFSHLFKLANENKDEELSDLIRDKVLDSINESPIRNLLLYEIPTSMKGQTFSYLIKEINKITTIEKTCNVLLSGKIYEYFIGRDESAISELGAYFTDRHIVDYIYKKLDPEINEDGSIDSIIDMFGGSGGFTTGYINYLNNKYDNINWKDNINKIYHYDMNEDVVKSAGLEFFCLTGVLPNMKDNLAYKNSFTDNFDNKKFMNIITNPPYGGDKVVQSDAQIKRKKIKEYINKELLTMKDELQIKTRLRQIKKIEDQEKQEKKDNDKTKVSVEMCSQRIIKYAKDNKLTGNDKESSSLILIMDMVDINGTAIGVLKEGVFFNKTYKNIRKCLIENFNVREIISVPQDQFENTSTKTSIIIFDNTKEKTTKVKFSELIVEKYTEDKFEEIGSEIVLTENKDDICGISDKIISEATKDEILKNPICSLNGKNYNKKEILVGEGYELVKLSELGVINCEKKLTKNKYNYIEISDINDNSITNFEKLTKDKLPVNAKNIVEYGNILISCVRPKKSKMLLITENIKDIDNYVFSTALANIKLKDKNSAYYVYSILYNLVDNFENELCNGSSYPRFKPADLLDVKIPIPKSKQKIIEWVNKISKPYDKKNNNKELIINLEEQIKNKYKNIEENEDCDNIKLEEILTRKNNGRTNTNDVTNTGIFPFYSATSENPSGITSNYDFDGENYLLFAKSGGSSKTIFGNTLGIGKFWLVSGKSSGNVAMIKFEINKEFNIKYIYYYLKYKLFEIQKLALYSTGNGNIQVEDMLKKFKIKIPKNKKLIKDIELLFDEIEKLQSEIKEEELQYKKLIKELAEEAMPTNLNNKQIEVKSDNETNELSEESNENIIILNKSISEKTPEKKPKTNKNKIKTKSNVV
jgi:type I restriction-modification system DNA methylase subunit